MKNENPSVLIIDGESDFSLPVLRSLAQIPGFKVHVLSSKAWPKTRYSRYCASFHYHDNGDEDARYLEVIAEVAKRVNADILLPVDQPAIRFVADHRLALGKLASVTPVPQVPAFDTAVDKWMLADFMQRRRIPTPRTIKHSIDADFWRQLDTLTFPVLIKPRCDGSGRGIRQFDDRNSLALFLEKEQKDGSRYIVQNRVAGYDIDCSVLCRDGRILAYTIQKGIFTNPMRFRPPLAIEFLGNEEVLQVMQTLLEALRWDGVAHVDLVMDEGDRCAKVIDFNARYWGSLLGSLAAGVNFPYLACLSALDKQLPPVTYDYVRYVAPSAMRQLRRQKYITKGVPRFQYAETGWRYLLADPMPVAMDKLSSVWKKFRSTSQR